MQGVLSMSMEEERHRVKVIDKSSYFHYPVNSSIGASIHGEVKSKPSRSNPGVHGFASANSFPCVVARSTEDCPTVTSGWGTDGHDVFIRAAGSTYSRRCLDCSSRLGKRYDCAPRILDKDDTTAKSRSREPNPEGERFGIDELSTRPLPMSKSFCSWKLVSQT